MNALQCQQDAARFASTADARIGEERRLGVRATTALLVQGHPDLAFDVILRSVERQARIAGCGRVHVALREVA